MKPPLQLALPTFSRQTQRFFLTTLVKETFSNWSLLMRKRFLNFPLVKKRRNMAFDAGYFFLSFHTMSISQVFLSDFLHRLRGFLSGSFLNVHTQQSIPLQVFISIYYYFWEVFCSMFISKFFFSICHWIERFFTLGAQLSNISYLAQLVIKKKSNFNIMSYLICLIICHMIYTESC